MKDFQGRTAVVTGAASGIGLALAGALARAGMNVVLSDVHRDRLDAAVAAIAAAGGQAAGCVTNVMQEDSVAALADFAAAKFGAVHVLCANAGVATHGSAWEQSLDNWKWTLGVNLFGVIHCLRAFVPRMLEHRQEGHVVLTASSAGLAGTTSSAYTASKSAVVGIAEGMVRDLDGTALGVSVLCPGGVRTGIFQSEQLRPADLAHKGTVSARTASVLAAMASPDRTDQAPPEFIAALVLDAIRDRTLYVLPMQARYKAVIGARLDAVRQAMEASPTTAP
ncbi:MAG: SDR family NAD(P)-dependent oxidoreductase [Gammaproteobacteria bacterium]